MLCSAALHVTSLCTVMLTLAHPCAVLCSTALCNAIQCLVVLHRASPLFTGSSRNGSDIDCCALCGAWCVLRGSWAFSQAGATPGVHLSPTRAACHPCSSRVLWTPTNPGPNTSALHETHEGRTQSRAWGIQQRRRPSIKSCQSRPDNNTQIAPQPRPVGAEPSRMRNGRHAKTGASQWENPNRSGCFYRPSGQSIAKAGNGLDHHIPQYVCDLITRCPDDPKGHRDHQNQSRRVALC